jgi:putative transposase
MPWGLKRYHGTGHLHFITCSCYHRLPLLGKPGRRTLFLELLEQTRQRYDFVVVGYVVMPEHFHILIGEPEKGTPSTVLQVVKQRFARPAETQGATNPVAGRREPVGSHLASPLL